MDSAKIRTWKVSLRSDDMVVEPPKKMRSGTYTLKLGAKNCTCFLHCHMAVGPKPWTRTREGFLGSGPTAGPQKWMVVLASSWSTSTACGESPEATKQRQRYVSHGGTRLRKDGIGSISVSFWWERGGLEWRRWDYEEDYAVGERMISDQILDEEYSSRINLRRDKWNNNDKSNYWLLLSNT